MKKKFVMNRKGKKYMVSTNQSTAGLKKLFLIFSSNTVLAKKLLIEVQNMKSSGFAGTGH
jgi:hypothetical protein